jgi:hypothetical protein
MTRYPMTIPMTPNPAIELRMTDENKRHPLHDAHFLAVKTKLWLRSDVMLVGQANCVLVMVVSARFSKPEILKRDSSSSPDSMLFTSLEA